MRLPLLLLTLLALGCRSETGASAVGPDEQTQDRPRDFGWENYQTPAGCSLDLWNAPSLVEDAERLASLLVAQTEQCQPERSAAQFDFTHSRIFVGRVAGAGFNPNTLESIHPEQVRLESDPVVVEIDVGPNCGGVDRGPGFVVLMLPASKAQVELRNLSQAQCNYGASAPPS